MTHDGSGLRVQLFSEPLLLTPEGPCRLSPFQSALLVLVFGEGGVSRPRTASALWGDETPATKTRQRIRQLKNEIRRRAGTPVLQADGDTLRPHSDVECDLHWLEQAMAEGRLADAARTLANGRPWTKEALISEGMARWSDAFATTLTARIVALASAKWQASVPAADWTAARDASEALYLLRPSDPVAVVRVIEARGRVGRTQAAEVAYAEFRQAYGPGTGFASVEEAITRVRELSQATPDHRLEPAIPFVGRKKPLADLTTIFERVRSGSFSIALVAGEAGIGKTRLIREVERYARLEGFRCLTAEPVELERRIPMNPLIDALSDVDLEPHLESIGEPWRTVIGTMLPPGPFAESVQDLPPIEERSLSRRLLDAFSLLLRSISDESPTIFFLDDLQWADATTIAALQFYQRRWKESFFGVVATARPRMIGRKDPAHPYLTDDGKLGVQRIDLEELTDEEARRLVELVGDEQMDASDVAKLCALSGRHPLYLTELTHDFLSGRLTLPKSEADAFTIPISLKQILASRMEDLDEAGRTVVNLLAVGSKPMRLGDLVEILDLTLDRAADAAGDLADRQLVDVDRDRLWIAHDLFRTAIYRDLGESHRAVLHQRLAQHIQANSGEEAAGELATHLDRAGELESSATYGWTAAGRAFERGAVAEAAHFYELVTRNERDESRRAEATAMLATSLHLNRDMSRANPALELASTRLRAAGMMEQARRMDIRRVEGLAEAGDTPVGELVERLGGIKSECRESADWEGVALALDTELGLKHSSGDFDGILDTFEEMRKISTSGPPEAQAVCHSGLAMGVLFGDADEALVSARMAVRLTENVRRHRLKALLRLMVVLQLRGRLQQGDVAPLVQEARELAKRSGDVRIRFSVESNIAVALLDAGELDRAQHMLDESTKLLGSADMEFNRFIQANNYAELALANSDFVQAGKHFIEARSYLGPTTPPYAEDLVNAGLGLCAIESGRLREAQQKEELLCADDGRWHYDPFTVVSFRSRLMELSGRREEARDLLVRTADDLEGRLELAWLKINKMRLEKDLKWSFLDGSYELARRCLDLSAELALHRRRAQFDAILNRVLDRQ